MLRLVAVIDTPASVKAILCPALTSVIPAGDIDT
jgi:hypothetical protein